MSHLIQNREHLLQNDKNQLFLQKWEKQSNKFGKKKILNLFQSAYDSIKSDGTDNLFKQKFDNIIINSLKEQKNVLSFKKETYKQIMSLFGKFKYTMDRYGDQIFDVLGGNSNSVQQENSVKKMYGNNSIQLTLLGELSQTHSDTHKTTLQDLNIDIDALYARDPDEPLRNR